MRVPLSLAAALVLLLTACSSPGATAHQPTAPPSDAIATPSATRRSSPARRQPRPRTQCACRPVSRLCRRRERRSTTCRPRRARRSPSSAPSARPRLVSRLPASPCPRRPTAAFCAEGRQPWRCGFSTVTDRQGHYGLMLFDMDAYDVSVRQDGYRAGGGLVRVAHPGVARLDWMLTPLP